MSRCRQNIGGDIGPMYNGQSASVPYSCARTSHGSKWGYLPGGIGMSIRDCMRTATSPVGEELVVVFVFLLAFTFTMNDGLQAENTPPKILRRKRRRDGAPISMRWAISVETTSSSSSTSTCSTTRTVTPDRKKVSGAGGKDERTPTLAWKVHFFWDSSHGI